MRTVAAAGVLLVAACGSDPAAVAAPAAPTAATSPSPSSPSAGGPTSAAPSAPSTSPRRTAGPVERQLAVTHRAGKVSGDTGRVKIRRGETIVLTVTSDVADEVHLHGYDKSVDVAAGGTAALRFTADLAGVFEVELEERHRQLLSLQVS